MRNLSHQYGAPGCEWDEVFVCYATTNYPGTVDIVRWVGESAWYIHTEPLDKDEPLAGPFESSDAAKAAWYVIVA